MLQDIRAFRSHTFKVRKEFRCDDPFAAVFPDLRQVLSVLLVPLDLALQVCVHLLGCLVISTFELRCDGQLQRLLCRLLQLVICIDNTLRVVPLHF